MEPIESTTHSTELYELPEAPSTWTSEAEQRVRAAQFGAMEKAVAAYTQVNQNLKAGGAGGAPLSQEAAERKFLRENRQESRPGADLNPVTSSTPVTTRQFLENKNRDGIEIDECSYKTHNNNFGEDYWLVRPTLGDFESLVEERLQKLEDRVNSIISQERSQGHAPVGLS
ncbi:hypothetical protein BC829DRAFT_420181 [Chytridium lagenaria]|nr:hypothetical protein BC829DRAFT_420181 [Chytridium lagenaria]